MALVVLTMVSSNAAASRRPVALGQVDQRWAGPWGWFASEPASSHMMAAGANEDYAPLGSFTFDQGAVPLNTH